MSQKVPDTRRLFITSRSMVTTFSAEFIIFACDTSTSRLPYPYLPLVHVTECGFISQCNAMQCFRVSECLPADWTSSYSVQCVHFCCLLHLAMTGTIQSGQSKSQTLLKILKEIYVTFGHFSHLSSVFKKNFCVCFCLQNLSKKTSFINFLSFEFLKRGIFGTTSILLHHFSTIAFKNGDVLREDNLCSDETFAQVITKFLQFSDSTTRQCPPSPVSASPPAAAAWC